MLEIGQTISGYRIEALLGSGAMGEVYRGQQLSLGRPVAIKRIAEHLLNEPGVRDRFEREARVVAGLDDAHIISVYDFGLFADADGDGHVLLIMELVAGATSLKHTFSLEQPLSWTTATAVIWQIAQGLRTAHDHGVVHRDIKPENILISRKGIAKLADFGLARGAESTALTMEGHLLGTPNYMSPEACHGEEVGPPGDIYSIGATWFTLLSGRPPFEASNIMALVRAHCEDQPPTVTQWAPELLPELQHLLDRCLAKEAAQRPTASELQRGIETALGGDLPPRLPDLCLAVETGEDSSTAPTSSGNETQTLAIPSGRDSQSESNISSTPPLEMSTTTRRRRYLTRMMWAAVVGLLVVGGLLWALNDSPLQEAQDQVQSLLAADAVAAALSTADAFVVEHPSEPQGHKLVTRVIAAEAEGLVDEERFEDALARLQQRAQERSWLDTAAIERDVLLAQAAFRVRNGWVPGALEIYWPLMERLRRDEALHRAILAIYIEEDAPAMWQVARRAVFTLRELDSETPPTADELQAMEQVLLYRSPTDEGGEHLRQWLLSHARRPILRKAQKWLQSADHELRRHGAFLLEQADTFEEQQELAYHLRNLETLSHSQRAMIHEAMDHVYAQANSPGWHQRVAAAGYASLDGLPTFERGGAFTDEVMELCVATLAPELREWALRMVALTGTEAEGRLHARWNAFRLLRRTSGSFPGNVVDLTTFHATTLTTFEPWFHPDALDAALAHFEQALQSPEARQAQRALQQGREHVLSVRQRVAEGNVHRNIIDANLAAMDALLAHE